MAETPEIIDRERPGVSDHESRLDQLAEAAREYERVKKAKARNSWEKREQAYGTPEEIQKASRILESSLQRAKDRVSERDIQQAQRDGLISEDWAEQLREQLSSDSRRDQNSRERD